MLSELRARGDIAKTQGRRLLGKVAHVGIDVGGVELSQPTSALYLVEGAARQIAAFRDGSTQTQAASCGPVRSLAAGSRRSATDEEAP